MCCASRAAHMVASRIAKGSPRLTFPWTHSRVARNHRPTFLSFQGLRSSVLVPSRMGTTCASFTTKIVSPSSGASRSRVGCAGRAPAPAAPGAGTAGAFAPAGSCMDACGGAGTHSGASSLDSDVRAVACASGTVSAGVAGAPTGAPQGSEDAPALPSPSAADARLAPSAAAWRSPSHFPVSCTRGHDRRPH